MFLFEQQETESVDFCKILADQDRGKKLNILREHARQAIDQEWNSKGLDSKLKQYYKELEELAVYVKDLGDDAFRKNGNGFLGLGGGDWKFSWKTILSASYNTGIGKTSKRKVKIEGSLGYEQLMVLVTMAFNLCNQAYFLTSSKVAMDDADRKQNEAADFLCQAAGIFDYAQSELSSRWINLPANRPPEVLTDMLKAMHELSMAEAHYVVYLKGRRKNMSASNLAKILMTCAEGLERCDQLLGSLTADYAELDDKLKDYSKNGVVAFKGLALLVMAKDLHESGKIGPSVLLASEANRYLQFTGKSSCEYVRRITADFLEDASDTFRIYQKTNDNVSYDKVPDISEIITFVPPSKGILTPKPFK